ncbi:DUF2635 domain-containing protein [Polaromonas sp. JS666]|uniref:DUF2635 domain-containing protein n=1 Tax=Polaromonas sp. (strain JS666 / ATCC BAA-500) TaxID=296591 RepID=UPI0000464B61|nr:DUF2635 domain-containing protein [Polaromonas sp. JS666]
MPEKIYLIPAPGLRVVNPATGQPLPPEGDTVEQGTYWIRRLNDGDVSEGVAPAQAAAKPASKKE